MSMLLHDHRHICAASKVEAGVVRLKYTSEAVLNTTLAFHCALSARFYLL